MARRLALVAVGGLLVGAVCLGAAAAIGGRDLARNAWDLSLFDGEACRVTPSGHDASRSLDWTGGDKVAIDLPGNVQYQRGVGDRLVVQGDSALLPLVEIDDDHVRLSCHWHRYHQRLTVTLPGRDFESYTLNGSGSMTLAGIDQPQLKIRVNGSGDVTASGRTDMLDYRVAGSGDGHFAALDAATVTVSIAGSGDADVTPRDGLAVNIAGSGTVTLHKEPQHLQTRIAGSGKIIHPDGSVTGMHGLHGSDMPLPPEPPEPSKGI